jgi:threonine/homoserine/homoserine lactone efflux protein
MMEFTLLALFVAAAINAAIPGPCILYVFGRSAASGPAAGLRVTVGIALADCLLVLAAWAVVLGALTLTAHGLEAMRIMGVVVLAALAITLILARPDIDTARPAQRSWTLGDAGAGAALALSSPLNLLFMLALLPQVIGPNVTFQSMVLASGVVVLGGLLPSLAACTLGARAVLLGPSATCWIQHAGGVAMLGFAGIAALTPT